MKKILVSLCPVPNPDYATGDLVHHMTCGCRRITTKRDDKMIGRLSW